MSVSPSSIHEGQSATFTISMNAPAAQDIVVNYVMSGRAILGSDYTLSTNAGQALIAAGQSSVTITLNAIVDNVKEKGETAIMTLQPGSGYNFGSTGGKKTKKSKAPSATVMISD